MKKRILSAFIVLVVAAHLTACGGTAYQEATGQIESNSSAGFAKGYFTVVAEWGGGDYLVVYANDTKVKYLVICRSQYLSGITPLYNADGTLQIYEESEE